MNALAVKGLCKRYPAFSLENVSFSVPEGAVMGFIGRNGAGKSTTLKALLGLVHPDAGEVTVLGKSFREEEQYIKERIGVVLGGIDFYPKKKVRLLSDVTRRFYGNWQEEKYRHYLNLFGIDQEKRVDQLSTGMRVKYMIALALSHDARLLILDEPTAVLTPQETEKLFTVLRNMKADGKAIVIITHKLHEVMALSDKVAVLRKGKYIGTVKTSETNPQALTDMMVGHSVTLNIDRPKYDAPVPRLTLKGITCYDGEGVKRLDNVSFTALGGEILGIAGIAGSGQRELLEAIAGLHPVAEGSIQFTPEGKPASELVGKTPMQIKKAGVAMAFVPEDRLGMGLVGSMGMTDNMMLRSWRKGKGIFVNRKDPNELAMQVWKELEVVTPSTDFPVRRMSGGNVQKVLVGREIATAPSVLMTAYAVRGLDINTSYTIYNLLTKEKMQGSAVIYVGEDLDVLLELCDRILVLCGGKVSGIVDGRTTTKEEVGLLMTRVGGKEKAAHE